MLHGVHYTNVGGGSYTFRVRACNSNGVWNTTGVAIPVIIYPPFWQTTWFRLLLLGLLAAFIYALTHFYTQNKLREQRVQFEQQRALDRERTRIATDMHDDLGAGLSTIRLWSEVLKMKQKGSADNSLELDKISTSASDLVTKMGEIVWAMNAKNDTLDSLIAYIRAYTADFFDPTDIICHIATPPQIPDITLLGEVRRNLFLTVKETLNNTLKHAACTHISIDIQIDSNTLTICIADNGKGIDTETLRQFGNGLRNMQQRMTAICGSYRIHNDSGTITDLVYPL